MVGAIDSIGGVPTGARTAPNCTTVIGRPIASGRAPSRCRQKESLTTTAGGLPGWPYAYDLLKHINDHKHYRAAYAGIQVYQGGAYPAEYDGTIGENLHFLQAM